MADYDRLKEENLSLREEIRALNDRLFAEIDSNREREDELVALAAPGPGVGRRRGQLAPPKRSEEPEEEAIMPELVFDDIPDADMVERRARDYMAEAAKNGIYYDFEMLCKAIRANPEEFLSN